MRQLPQCQDTNTWNWIAESDLHIYLLYVGPKAYQTHTQGWLNGQSSLSSRRFSNLLASSLLEGSTQCGSGSMRPLRISPVLLPVKADSYSPCQGFWQCFGIWGPMYSLIPELWQQWLKYHSHSPQLSPGKALGSLLHQPCPLGNSSHAPPWSLRNSCHLYLSIPLSLLRSFAKFPGRWYCQSGLAKIAALLLPQLSMRKFEQQGIHAPSYGTAYWTNSQGHGNYLSNNTSWLAGL